MKILFSERAWEDYLYWQQTDKKMLSRVNNLIKDIQRNPHSGIGKPELLQGTLCQTISQITKPKQIALAFPELRCVFGGLAIVPDIAVFRWERIPRLPSGRIANRFEIHPDWAIEILSPDQRYKQVLGKLLHCAEYGTELGWLLDAEDETILVVDSDRRVQEFTNSDRLPVLTGIDLDLTVEQVFSWLSF